MSEEGLAALRRLRDKARNRFVLAVVLLFALGGATRLAGAGGMGWLLVLLLAGCALLGLEWAWRAIRLRRAYDPWAYDPELDGPIAQEIEGRSFGPPRGRGPQP